MDAKMSHKMTTKNGMDIMINCINFLSKLLKSAKSSRFTETNKTFLRQKALLIRQKALLIRQKETRNPYLIDLFIYITYNIYI